MTHTLAPRDTALGKAQRDAINFTAQADSSNPFAAARMALELAHYKPQPPKAEGLPWGMDSERVYTSKPMGTRKTVTVHADLSRDPKRLQHLLPRLDTATDNAIAIAQAANQRVNERRGMIDRDYRATLVRLGLQPYAYKA
jgi:hypothetical protein